MTSNQDIQKVKLKNQEELCVPLLRFHETLRCALISSIDRSPNRRLGGALSRCLDPTAGVLDCLGSSRAGGMPTVELRIQ